MIDIGSDIESLTDFKRNTLQYLARLRRSGNPVVLTVNGKARLVVQDAAAYQDLLEAIDRAEAIAGIREGLASMKAGKGRPAFQALEEIRKKRRIPRR